jgi:hypothetical protein
VYEIIPDRLAVEGIGEDMHPMIEGEFKLRDDGWYQIDARTISDLGEENDIMSYKILIYRALAALGDYNKVVIVCGAGQSRSNAIALGVLVEMKMDFYQAWELVKKKNPTCYIDPSHIDKLKSIFGVTLP